MGWLVSSMMVLLRWMSISEPQCGSMGTIVFSVWIELEVERRVGGGCTYAPLVVLFVLEGRVTTSSRVAIPVLEMEASLLSRAAPLTHCTSMLADDTDVERGEEQMDAMAGRPPGREPVRCDDDIERVTGRGSRIEFESEQLEYAR